MTGSADLASPGERRRVVITGMGTVNALTSGGRSAVAEALALGRFDHGATDAVLDATARIEVLELPPDGGELGTGQAVEPHHGSVTNEIERCVRNGRTHQDAPSPWARCIGAARVMSIEGRVASRS